MHTHLTYCCITIAHIDTDLYTMCLSDNDGQGLHVMLMYDHTVQSC